MTIDQFINALVTITLIEMMVAIGLGVTFADVIRVARNWRLVAQAVLANYICVPAAAVGLLLLFRAEPMVAAGFLIAAVCPGAPYAPPFTALAKGNVPVSVGLMVMLAGTSALAAGWLSGLPGSGNRRAMAITTAVRNVGVGLVIATSGFPGTAAVTATLAFALFQTVVMAIVALAWGRWSATPPEAAGGTTAAN
jgi:predicted Na+-dependent transporter